MINAGGEAGEAGDSLPAVFGSDSGFTPGHTLPPGLQLRDYRIDAVLGEGGFGVVYLALDTALERRVAIKEYLPAGMASRARGSLTVFVKSASHRDTFAAGLRSFVNEARLLARFDHQALVKVHQFWEENGTAYMVMPYYEGPTLKRTLAELGRPPTEAELRRWLMPLLDALAVLHAERCYHRDIAPDNILITPGGPLLLDFGAARRVIGDMTQALTAVLKPGFAPIEQYGEVPGMSQGPWTDIFALASVLYVALAGVKPMSSIERVMDDRLRPLSDLAAGRASKNFLTAVDRALALLPADRPQTVAEFLANLDGKAGVGGAPAAAPPVPELQQFVTQLPAADEATIVVDLRFEPIEPTPTSEPRLAAGKAGTASPPPGAAALAPPPAAKSPLAAKSSTAVPSAARRRALGLSLGGGGLLLAAVAGWLWTSRHENDEPPPLTPRPSAAAPASQAAAMPTPAPLPAPVTAPSPAPTPEPAAPPPTMPSTSPGPEPSPRQPRPQPQPQLQPQPQPQAPPQPQPQAQPQPATTAPSPTLSPSPTTRPTPARPAATKPATRPADKPPAETAVAGPRKGANKARCSDILQRASLEPITASEAEFLKKECR